MTGLKTRNVLDLKEAYLLPKKVKRTRGGGSLGFPRYGIVPFKS